VPGIELASAFVRIRPQLAGFRADLETQVKADVAEVSRTAGIRPHLDMAGFREQLRVEMAGSSREFLVKPRLDMAGFREEVRAKTAAAGGEFLVRPKLDMAGFREEVRLKTAAAGSEFLVKPKLDMIGFREEVRAKTSMAGSEFLVRPKLDMAGFREEVRAKTALAASEFLVKPKLDMVGFRQEVRAKTAAAAGEFLVKPHLDMAGFRQEVRAKTAAAGGEFLVKPKLDMVGFREEVRAKTALAGGEFLVKPKLEMAGFRERLTAAVMRASAGVEAVIRVTADTAPAKRKVAEVAAETRALGAETGALGRVGAESYSLLGEHAGRLGRYLQVAKLGVLGLGLAFAGAVYEGVKMSADYTREMTKVQALTDSSGENFKKIRVDVLNLSGSTARAPKELADALYFIESGGLRGSRAMDALTMTARAAATGLGNTKDVAQLLVGSMNAYSSTGLTAKAATDMLVAGVTEGHMPVDELARSLGRVQGVAAALHVSFPQVVANIAAMTKTGMSSSQAATSLQSVITALGRMDAPSKMVAGAMKEVGISSASVRKEMQEKGLNATLNDIANRTQAWSKANHGSNAALLQLFPNVRALRDITGTSIAQQEAYNHVLNRVEHATDGVGRANEAFGITQRTLPFRIREVTNAIRNDLTKFGDAMAPVINRIFDWAASVGPGVMRFFRNLREGFQAFLPILGPFVAAFLTPLVAAFTLAARAAGLFAEALAPVGRWLSQYRGWFEPVLVAVGTFVGLMTTWKLVTAAWTVVTRIAAAAQLAFNLVMDANPIMLVVVGIAALAAGMIYAYQHSKTFRDVMDSLGRWFSHAGGDIIQWAKDFGHWMMIGFRDVAGAVGAVGRFFVRMGNDIAGAFNTVLTFAQRIWKDVAGFFERLWHDVSGFTSRLWRDVTGFFERIWRDTAGFAARIWHDVTGFFERIKTDVSNVVTGILDFVDRHWRLLLVLFTGPIGLVIVVVEHFHKQIGAFFTRMWNDVSTFTSRMWADVTGFFHVGTLAVTGIVTSLWRDATLFFRVGWQTVSGLVTRLWRDVTGLFTSGARTTSDTTSGLWRTVTGFFTRMWRDVTGWVSRMWDDITGFFSRGASWVWDNILRPFLNRLVRGWTNTWHDVTGFVSRMWDDVSGFFTRGANWVFDNILRPFWDRLVRGWTNTWHDASRLVSNLWHDVTGFFGHMRDDVVGIFDDLVTKVGHVWDRVKEIVAGPIRWVIDVPYDQGIVPLIHGIGDILHEPGMQHLAPLHFAGGGPIPGNHDRDDVPFYGTPGELVVPKPVVARFGGPDTLMGALGFTGTGGAGGHYAVGGPLLPAGFNLSGANLSGLSGLSNTISNVAHAAPGIAAARQFVTAADAKRIASTNAGGGGILDTIGRGISRLGHDILHPTDLLKDLKHLALGALSAVAAPVVHTIEGAADRGLRGMGEPGRWMGKEVHNIGDALLALLQGKDDAYNAAQAAAAAAAAGGGGFMSQVGNGTDIVNQARKYLGQQYVLGGNPYGGAGTDCSGLVDRVMADLGHRLPGRPLTWDLVKMGQAINYKDALPGDLVFTNYGEGGIPGPGHVGIYEGAGRMIDDPNPSSHVREEAVWETPGAVRRLLVDHLPTVSAAAAVNGNWANVVYQALQMENLPASAAGGVLRLIQSESGGNPNAQNNWDCLTVDDMILTRRGWLKHDEVQVGDETIGYNHATGCSEWTPVRRVIQYADAPLIRMHNSRWSVTSTPNHRWLDLPRVATPVEPLADSCTLCEWPRGVRRTGATMVGGLRIHLAKVHGVKGRSTRSEYRTQPVWATTEQVHSRSRLLLSARADTAGSLDISVSEAALLGWIAGDGHVETRKYGPSMSVAQSKPKMVEKLRRLMAEFPHADYVDDRLTRTGQQPCGPRHQFRLDYRYAQDLLRRAGHPKRDAEVQVLAMNSEQRAAWLEAVIDAEGSVDRRGKVSISQSVGPVLDAITLAVYLSGRRPRACPDRRTNQPENWADTATVRANSPVVTGATLQKEAVGRGDVWCVTTDLGSWTAREGDHVFLTGNSNARAGTPSQGLMQLIPGTFAANHWPGTSWNLRDPLANVAAGINYAVKTYGIGMLMGGGRHDGTGRYVGYDTGGVLHPGMTRAVNLSGKPEAVLTNSQWADIKRLAVGADRAGLPAAMRLPAAGPGTGHGADLHSVVEALHRLADAPQRFGSLQHVEHMHVASGLDYEAELRKSEFRMLAGGF